MKIEAIVVNPPSGPLTVEALQALLRSLGDLDAHVTVAGAELRSKVIEDGLPARVSVISSGKNASHAAAINLAIRHGRERERDPDYYYLLHAGAFPEEGAIHALLAFLSARPGAGLAASYVYDGEGFSQRNAFRFPVAGDTLSCPASAGVLTRVFAPAELAIGLPSQPARVEWATGTSLMIRREVLGAAGLLDEELSSFFVEADLCARARQKGYSTYYVPQSRVLHLGDPSIGSMRADAAEQWARSRQRFMRKHQTVPALPESGAFRPAARFAAS